MIVNEFGLKSDIYKVLKKYFYGFDQTCHDVARDQTSEEMRKLVDTYYKYLNK